MAAHVRAPQAPMTRSCRLLAVLLAAGAALAAARPLEPNSERATAWVSQASGGMGPRPRATPMYGFGARWVAQTGSRGPGQTCRCPPPPTLIGASPLDPRHTPTSNEPTAAGLARALPHADGRPLREPDGRVRHVRRRARRPVGRACTARVARRARRRRVRPLRVAPAAAAAQRHGVVGARRAVAGPGFPVRARQGAAGRRRDAHV
jgi:hypothetical protein